MLLKQVIAFDPLPYVLIWIPPTNPTLSTRNLCAGDPQNWGESEVGMRGRSIKGPVLGMSQIWATGGGGIWGTVGVGGRTSAHMGTVHLRFSWLPKWWLWCGHQQSLLHHNKKCLCNKILPCRKISELLRGENYKPRTPASQRGLLLFNYLV